MLTNATVKAARPGARPYKLFDAGGLYLFVRPSGTKTWRMKYRVGGREQLLTFGAWPGLDLSEARERRDLARERIDRGEDPSADDAADTFEQLARRWHAEQAPHWSIAHAADVIESLERDVFPAIGAAAPADVRPRQVLELLRAVEARGCIETARRLRERISGVMRLGVHDELVDSDPAEIVADRLSPRPVSKPQPALLELEPARALLAAAGQASGSAIIKLASQFLALTVPRMNALRGAGWHEIEDLDGAEPLWRIPPARMKLIKVRKADPAAEHVVPLSRQAVAVLLELRQLTGGTGLIFPGLRPGRPIGEAAIADLYRRSGFAGRHVPHGWRATFSTILNERFPDEQQLIDQALGHAARKGKVEGAYNRARHLERTRDLMQRWADLALPG